MSAIRKIGWLFVADGVMIVLIGLFTSAEVAIWIGVLVAVLGCIPLIFWR